VIDAVREQAAPDAATPVAGVDVEHVELGIEVHVAIARRSADGEADDGVIFDRDEDGAVARGIVEPDSGPVFPAVGDRERLQHAGREYAGIGCLPSARVDRRDAIDILRASRADHAAFRMRKE
jgi:hypothetical protein